MAVSGAILFALVYVAAAGRPHPTGVVGAADTHIIEQRVRTPSTPPREDFFVVVQRGYAAALKDYVLAKSTWLAGIHSVFITDEPVNATMGELGVVYVAPEPLTHVKARFPTDHFMLEGILAAQQRFRGLYKWMLVGDADTFFLLGNTYTRLLPEDHTQPLFFGMVHPPACSRCSCVQPYTPNVAPFCCPEAPQGSAKPCNVSATYRQPNRKDFPVCSIRACDPAVDGTCTPNQPWVWGGMEGKNDPYALPSVWPFGGAGVILSAGLVESVGDAAIRECAEKIVCFGCDVRVAICLYDSGIALTHMEGLHDNAGVWQNGFSLSGNLQRENNILPPLSYHHVHDVWISQLWEAEISLNMHFLSQAKRNTTLPVGA